MSTNVDFESPIGIRVLSPTMMECSFQHTDAVLTAINKIRKTATESHERFCDVLLNNPDQSIMEARGYNNAISILGSRGSGKTSIIMTIQHILTYGKEAWKEEKSSDILPENIIMPILVPQDFSKDQSLLSWVIVQLLKKGEEIERQIEKNNLYICQNNTPIAKWCTNKQLRPGYNPLRECMDTLTSSFELRCKNERNYADREDDHVYQYMDEVRRDSSLVLDMLKLISMMVDYYQILQRNSYGNGEARQEPLIFFVIDDLDLAPERSQEVLNLVLRYLQHPNLVVLCGWNQELFQSHLCIDILKNQNALSEPILDYNFGYDDVFMTRQRQRIAALDSARRLAMDNLKKAFPPALRYEIRSLNTDQRAWFPHRPDGELSLQDQTSFLPLIEKTLMLCRNENDLKQAEFLHNAQGEYLKIYMRIFDNKARGMTNVYRAFKMLQLRIQQWDRKNDLNLTADIVSLLDTILFSNTHFVPYRRGLRDLVRIDRIILPAKKNGQRIYEYYCNYKAVDNVMKEYNNVVSSIDEDTPLSEEKYVVERMYNYFPSVIIDAYLLLNFMQNLIEFICRAPRYEHGGTEFSNALNKINPPIRIAANVDDLLSCTLALSGIEKLPLFPVTNDFRLNLCLLDAYEKNHFSDRQYDFMGSHSYSRLSRLIVSLIGSSTEARDKLDEERLNSFRKKVPQWMNDMESIFYALCFTTENVQRLAKYRSLLLQGIIESQEELVKIASDTSCDPLFGESLMKSNEDKTITDAQLDDLVNILRYLDNVRRGFNANVREFNRRKEKNEKILYTNINSMLNYYEIFGPYSKLDEKRWVDIDYYRKELLRYRKMPVNDAEPKNEINLSLLDSIMNCINENINLLLLNLEWRLQIAFQREYAKKETQPDQFTFLLSASEAVAKYSNRWNLGGGFWSDIEDSAAYDMMVTFRKSFEYEQYTQARKLANLGPTLEDTKRDVYTETFNSLNQWVNANQRLFSEETFDRLTKDLSILQKAAERIRRRTVVDDQIRDKLNSFGLTIAQMCADIAFSDELLEDKTSSERNTTAWPVMVANRNAFDIWKNTNEIRELSNRQKPQMDMTLFSR